MNTLTRSCLVVLAVTFAVMIADATPALGDKSTFDVSLTKGTQRLDGSVVFELTNYNKSTNTWTQTSVTEFNGQKQTQTESIEAKDLLDDTMIDAVIAGCAAQGGTSENLSVPAGTFSSCAVPVDNTDGTGTVWVARVPFGYAKWIANRRDGITVTGQLRRFQAGTPQTLK